MLMPGLAPGFRIRDGSSVFTIGSCFARNVEAALHAAGVRVPTVEFSAPKEEAPGRPNRVLDQYNPATMVQCVQMAGQDPGEGGLYPSGDGVVDALLATGGRPVSPGPRAGAAGRDFGALCQWVGGVGHSDRDPGPCGNLVWTARPGFT